MRTVTELKMMRSLAKYRYDHAERDSVQDVWEGWMWALLWAIDEGDEVDYDYYPKSREEALTLAKLLGIPKEWI